MKKIFLMVVALLTVVTTIYAERVLPDDAQIVANNFINSISSNSISTKSAPKKKISLRRLVTAQANQFYVYEAENGEGWVMVASDDVAHPILAYSNSGYFRLDNMPVNIAEWLSGYNSEIRYAINNDLKQDEQVAQEWQTLRKSPLQMSATEVVPALIKTKWDQEEAFCTKCPYDSNVGEYTLTGCVATAMAQVMNYWKWPKKGTGSHSYDPLICANSSCTRTRQVYPKQTVDFSATTYDWDNMKDYYISCSVSGGEVSCENVSYTKEEGEAVATLMWHCGVAVDMMYDIADNGGSGAWTIRDDGTPSAESALPEYFGYKTSIRGLSKSDYSSTAWTNLLKKELDAGRPMIYAGGAHCFVCDGYDSQNYFHMNWGWSGVDDGFFSLSALNPPTLYGAGGDDYSFTSQQETIIGIEPNGPVLADDETTLEYSLKGVTIKSGTPAGVIKKNTAISAALEASSDKYISLTASNTTVNLTIGGVAANYASFSDGVLTISVPADKVTDKVVISVAATKDPEKITDCDAYEYEYTQKVGSGVQTLGDKTWTITLGNGEVQQYDANRGEHFGSNKNPAETVSYSTSDFDECVVNNIVIGASAGAGAGTIEAFVGETSLGSKTLTASNVEYTFENKNELQGTVKFVLNASTKALYVKSIAVNNTGDTPITPSEALTNLLALKNANEGQYEVILQDAVVTYSDGTNALLQDATSGLYLYRSAGELQKGNVINGTVKLTTVNYSNLIEATSFDLQSAVLSTDESKVVPVEVTVAELTNTNNYNRYESVYIKVTSAVVVSDFSNKSAIVEQNGSQITLRDQNKNATITIEPNSEVEITGWLSKYNTTPQIMIWEQSQIKEVSESSAVIEDLDLTNEAIVLLYDITGKAIRTSIDDLQPGVYIIQNNKGNAKKVLIK